MHTWISNNSIIIVFFNLFDAWSTYSQKIRIDLESLNIPNVNIRPAKREERSIII